MARAIWTGSLAFGLVNVPVGLYSATEDRTIHFNQFQAGTSDRIRYQRVNERTGREVDLAHIVRGHEVGKDDYVLISDEDLEAIEPGRSRTIEITDFVELAEIDPIYYQKAYYLGPQGDSAARPYALLHRAMSDIGRAGIATFVMHGKQYLVAIRAVGDVLALETMYFADEVRDPHDVIAGLPTDKSIQPRELTIARQLVDSMTATWDPGSYRDTYRERVEDLIKRKRRGEEVITEGAPPEEPNVTDLMEALRRSAEQMRERRPAKGATSKAKAKPRRRKAGSAGVGRCRAAHVQAGDGARRARAPLDEIADPVDQPQAVAAGSVGGLAPSPGQRVGDVSVILHLAEHLIGRAPGTDHAAAGRVADRVGGQLADREHQVAGAARIQAGGARLAGRELPDRSEVPVEGHEHGVAGWRRERIVTSWRELARAEVAGAWTLVSGGDDHRMGSLHVTDHARGQS